MASLFSRDLFQGCRGSARQGIWGRPRERGDAELCALLSDDSMPTAEPAAARALANAPARLALSALRSLRDCQAGPGLGPDVNRWVVCSDLRKQPHYAGMQLDLHSCGPLRGF